MSCRTHVIASRSKPPPPAGSGKKSAILSLHTLARNGKGELVVEGFHRATGHVFFLPGQRFQRDRKKKEMRKDSGLETSGEEKQRREDGSRRPWTEEPRESAPLKDPRLRNEKGSNRRRIPEILLERTGTNKKEEKRNVNRGSERRNISTRGGENILEARR